MVENFVIRFRIDQSQIVVKEGIADVFESSFVQKGVGPGFFHLFVIEVAFFSLRLLLSSCLTDWPGFNDHFHGALGRMIFVLNELYSFVISEALSVFQQSLDYFEVVHLPVLTIVLEQALPLDLTLSISELIHLKHLLK